MTNASSTHPRGEFPALAKVLASSSPEDRVLRLGPTVVRLDTRQIARAQGTEHLTEREAELLAVLSERANQDVPRGVLLEAFGYAPTARTRVVDIAVRRLRAKIEEDPSSPRHLLTVYGVGYRLHVPDRLPSSEPAPVVGGQGGPLCPLYESRRALLEEAMEALRAGERLWLRGPLGGGRSVLPTHLRRELGVPLLPGRGQGAEALLAGLPAKELGVAVLTDDVPRRALMGFVRALRARGFEGGVLATGSGEPPDGWREVRLRAPSEAECCAVLGLSDLSDPDLPSWLHLAHRVPALLQVVAEWATLGAPADVRQRLDRGEGLLGVETAATVALRRRLHELDAPARSLAFQLLPHRAPVPLRVLGSFGPASVRLLIDEGWVERTEGASLRLSVLGRQVVSREIDVGTREAAAVAHAARIGGQPLPVCVTPDVLSDLLAAWRHTAPEAPVWAELALRIQDTFARLGPPSGQAEFLDEALRTRLDPALRVTLTRARAVVAVTLREPEARQRLLRALKLAEQGAAPLEVILLSCELSLDDLDRRHPDRAHQRVGEAVAAAEGPHALAWALHYRGIVRYRTGDLERSEADMRAALVQLSILDQPRLRCGLLMNLGVVHQQRGQMAIAIPYYRQALEAAEHMGFRMAQARVKAKLGMSMVRTDAAAAVPLLEQAVEQARRAGIVSSQLDASNGLSWALLALDRLAEARHHLRRAIRFSEGAGYGRVQAQFLGTLGIVCALQGDVDVAEEYMRQAESLARDYDERVLQYTLVFWTAMARGAGRALPEAPSRARLEALGDAVGLELLDALEGTLAPEAPRAFLVGPLERLLG